MNVSLSPKLNLDLNLGIYQRLKNKSHHRSGVFQLLIYFDISVGKEDNMAAGENLAAADNSSLGEEK